MTHLQLDKELASLEAKRNHLIKELGVYSTDVLNKKPSADEWSVIEVLDHLVSVERAALSYVQKKMQDKASAKKTGIKEWFRSVLLNGYLKYSKKKFPAPLTVVPTITHASLKEMQDQWNTVRHDMKQTIIAVPADLLGHNWFKHPAIGKINLMQMLTFIDAHYNRHEIQIWSTVKKVS